MEYVVNAQGQTVTVAGPGAVAPASIAPAIGGYAASVSTTAVAPVVPASGAAPAITVVGTSVLERIKDEYEREVARVEADFAAVKAFETRVAGVAKAEYTELKVDLSKVSILPKATKAGIIAGIVVAFGAGVAFDHLLRVIF